MTMHSAPQYPGGWYAVDLDGTLAEAYWPTKADYHPFRIGKPLKPMVARVRALLAEGREVRIFTARVGPNGSAPGFEAKEYDVEAIRAAIRKWTLDHIGTALEATCIKDHGMRCLYDDRAVRIVYNVGVPCCEWPS